MAPWRPEDWSPWLRERPGSYDDPPPIRAMREILVSIPDRRRKTALSIGDAGCPELPFLHENFARVVVVEPGPQGLRFPGVADVAVSTDPMGCAGEAGIDRFFGQVRDRLSEGGIFLATFPASHHVAPFPMSLEGWGRRHGPAPMHEVELQYRLHRVGFQGLRVRRFPGDPESGGGVLCMAVRRANN